MMETLTHANDADLALSEFFRALKPGGLLVLHEYEHGIEDRQSFVWKTMVRLSDHSHTPAVPQFLHGTLQRKLEQAGFVDVRAEDLTQNIAPMFYLFVVLASIPYLFIRLLGLQTYSTNAVSAVECWLFLRKTGRHVTVTGSEYSSLVVRIYVTKSCCFNYTMRYEKSCGA
jgi:sterol 24-C-methyltransferase